MRLVLPINPPEPDTSTCPAKLPWLPWKALARERAAGHDVTEDVTWRLRYAIRGRASSVAQVLALRDWLDEAVVEALARIDADARAMAPAEDH